MSSPNSANHECVGLFQVCSIGLEVFHLPPFIYRLSR